MMVKVYSRMSWCNVESKQEIKYPCKQCGADISYERLLNPVGVELCLKCIKKNHRKIVKGK